jgi:HD-GYP domain-containing protein (c-di-GMP phosphodiesterase class II)
MNAETAYRQERQARSVRHALRRLDGPGLGLLVLLLLIPLGLTLAFRAVPRFDVVFESALFHLVVVSAIAACALMVALFTAVVAARARQAAPVLLALGCVFVGTLMLGHGLTTPGIGGRPMNLWVARFPVLAIAGFALCLGAAAAGESSALKRLVHRFPRISLATVTSILTAGSLFIVLRPTAILGGRPFAGETTVTHAVIAASGLILLATGGIHWRRWRLGRDRVQLGLVVACWLSVDALISFEVGHLWRISWWDYHAYLLAGFAATAWAVATESRRVGGINRALSGVSISDPLEQIARGYPEALNALVGAVEAKDRYTHGHSVRVADLSVRIGLRLDLGPDSLRALAQGAYLHDIGKIGVPDEVLNKPGSLNDDEWTWIEAHPGVGWEMASRAPSLRAALSVIRHHHERWDGTGYPDKMTGKAIPMAARIAALADVWDAVTSDRAYRPAWELDRALAHIAAAGGTLFDPLCVDAFLDLVSERGLWPERPTEELDTLSAAAEACHSRATHRRPA